MFHLYVVHSSHTAAIYTISRNSVHSFRLVLVHVKAVLMTISVTSAYDQGAIIMYSVLTNEAFPEQSFGEQPVQK